MGCGSGSGCRGGWFGGVRGKERGDAKDVFLAGAAAHVHYVKDFTRKCYILDV